MRCFLTLLLISTFIQVAIGQSRPKTEKNESIYHFLHGNGCAGHPHKSRAELIADKRMFLAWQSRRAIQSRSSQATLRTIPVVFHLIEDTASITDQDIRIAMASLNNAFSHSNENPLGADFSQGNLGVDTQIEFCLARRAPDGGRTKGIVRWSSDYFNMDQDLEDAKVKTQGQWDPRYYLNIYVVSRIDSELFATYTGRTWWTRSGLSGYAGGPGGVTDVDARTDGVVVAGIGAGLLAHEIGHYLSLAHTFSPTCANNDCLVDGDQICDTPPDVIFSTDNCNLADNSCNTDTLSNYSNGNFTMDVNDMVTNFMDYSSCPQEFTQGQADRMLFTLDNFRINLAVEAPSNNDACTTPCTDSIDVSFTISERHPEPNVPITFEATATGIDTYEWYIDTLGNTGSGYTITWERGYTPDSAVLGTNVQFTNTFSEPGKYRIYLKAWNSSNPSCFASYSRVIRVTCLGIDARFFPDKRIIASKQSAAKLLDTVLFKNRSVNATEYEWTVDHFPYDNQTPAQTTFKSNLEDLRYTFLEPGDYEITLIARNGMCVDTCGPFLLPVEDPTIDARIEVNSIDCYQEDSLRIDFRIINDGYDTIRTGFPITFYDEDPFQAAPSPTILGTYRLDKLVYGRDTPEDFTVVLPVSRAKLDQIWIVVNDTGSVSFPLSWPLADRNVMSVNSEFPPSGFNELDYNNNEVRRIDFQFAGILGTDGAINCSDQEVTLAAGFRNANRLDEIRWLPETNLSCTDCFMPILQLRQDSTTEQRVIFTSEFGCVDTASLTLPEAGVIVPLPDINPVPELCPGDTGLDLANFVQGSNLTWYTAIDATNGSNSPPVMDTNTPGTFNVYATQTIDACEGSRIQVSYTIKSAPIAPMVNDSLSICEATAAPDLITLVSGNSLLWYDASTGGAGETTVPILNTNNAGVQRFWVSQTENACESPRAELPISIVSLPGAPQVVDLQPLCVGSNAPDLLSAVSGTDLLWYDMDSGGIGNTQPPLTDTQSPGIFTFWVSQSVGACEGPRSSLSYEVLPPPTAPQVGTIPDICAGDTSPDLALSVRGANLLWYDSLAGGVSNSQVPSVNTQVAGTVEFWVTQSAATCESDRTLVQFTIKPTPGLPSLQGDPQFCRNSVPALLSDFIDGNDLTWYTGISEPNGTKTVPNILTDQIGKTSFWISQTEDGCEGARIELSYEVIALPLAPQIQDIPGLCPGDNPPNLGSLVNGNNLLWYNTETGGMGTDVTPIANTQIIGVNNFWVSQSDANCESERAVISYEVVMPPAPPQVDPINDLCEGATNINLGAVVSGTNLRWYAEETDSTGQLNTPSGSTSNPGLFQWWITQSDGNCESQRVRLSYRIKETPGAPPISEDPTICRGEVLPDLLPFVKGSGLNWYQGEQDTFSSTAPPTIRTDSAGVFPLWVSQSQEGCEGPRAILPIKIIGLELIPYGPYQVLEGTSEQIEAEVLIEPIEEVYGVFWEDPQGNRVGGDTSVLIIAPTEDGIYKMQAQSGACIAVAEIAVEVFFQLDATRVFSPNGDGRNDTWYIGDIEQFPNASVTIFNRWGDIVYRAQPYTNNWDGRDQQGRDLPMATYYYVIELNEDNREPVTGSITIKR